MLFPPPGVKIRRTIETQFLPDTPLMIAEHDVRRILLVVLIDQADSSGVAFAGDESGLSTSVNVGYGYPLPWTFIGPEELWARMTPNANTHGVNILIQSVFYD